MRLCLFCMYALSIHCWGGSGRVRTVALPIQRPRPRGARLQLPETRNKNPISSYQKQVNSYQ